jgi:hypothetical protein
MGDRRKNNAENNDKLIDYIVCGAASRSDRSAKHLKDIPADALLFRFSIYNLNYQTYFVHIDIPLDGIPSLKLAFPMADSFRPTLKGTKANLFSLMENKNKNTHLR